MKTCGPAWIVNSSAVHPPSRKVTRSEKALHTVQQYTWSGFYKSQPIALDQVIHMTM
jgi:hypothetical protein